MSPLRSLGARLGLHRAREAGRDEPLTEIDGYLADAGAFAASVRSRFVAGPGDEEHVRQALAGSIKLHDALVLRRKILAARPARILEVGAFLGFSTRWILESSAAFGARLTSVDPNIRHRIFDDPSSHLRAFCGPHRSRLTIRRGFFSVKPPWPTYDYEHYEPKLSIEQAQAVIDEVPLIDAPFDHFDFMFIDGDHTYNSVIDNLLLALGMANPGAVICLHDALSWPDVVPAARKVEALLGGFAYDGTTGDEFRSYMRMLAEAGGITYALCDGLAFGTVGGDAAALRARAGDLRRDRAAWWREG